MFSDHENYYLGDFTIAENKQEGGLLMVICRQSTNKKENEADVQSLNKRRMIKHPHLLQLKEVKTDTKSSLCSTMYFVRATYEYYGDNLRKEIARRRRNKEYYSAIELLRLLYDTIDVLAFLEAHQISHGELNPALIFLFDDDVEGLPRAKVCERLSASADSQVNNLNALNHNMELYMDQELFESLSKTQKPDATVDAFK